MRFSKNELIPMKDGTQLTVIDLLGEGGQGEVYLVGDGQKEYALKVYKMPVSPDFRYNLKNNIDRGSPSPMFLWPQKLLDFDDGKIGYLMDIRPRNYVSFVSYLTGRNTFRNLATKLRWCISLCLAFKQLHELGYSYQDLNDGSFFLDPDTGALLICDNDNVTADKKNLGILGKMRYMAPEIVRGDLNPITGVQQMPDVHSDRFSLAIILFMSLCLGNPFEGERLKRYELLDEHAEYELYGSNPVFVYHKTDRSNRPIRGYHTSLIKYWPGIPLYIKEAFHRTFVDGLYDRENERTTELEWLRLLSRYRDELIRCNRCGKEYILGLGEKKPQDVCPFCGKPTKEICCLKMGKATIALDLDKELFETHVDKYSSNYNRVIGRVVANPKHPEIWGIRTDGVGDVMVQDQSGIQRLVPDGGIIPIVRGLKIKLNQNMIGEIES